MEIFAIILIFAGWVLITVGQILMENKCKEQALLICLLKREIEILKR